MMETKLQMLEARLFAAQQAINECQVIVSAELPIPARVRWGWLIGRDVLLEYGVVWRVRDVIDDVAIVVNGEQEKRLALSDLFRFSYEAQNKYEASMCAAMLEGGGRYRP